MQNKTKNVKISSSSFSHTLYDVISIKDARFLLLFLPVCVNKAFVENHPPYLCVNVLYACPPMNIFVRFVDFLDDTSHDFISFYDIRVR